MLIFNCGAYYGSRVYIFLHSQYTVEGVYGKSLMWVNRPKLPLRYDSESNNRKETRPMPSQPFFLSDDSLGHTGEVNTVKNNSIFNCLPQVKRVGTPLSN